MGAKKSKKFEKSRINKKKGEFFSLSIICLYKFQFDNTGDFHPFFQKPVPRFSTINLFIKFFVING